MKKKRPLSPHLSIYKPQISSILSIAHRISGAFLFLGALILSWLIYALIFYPKITEYNFFNGMIIDILLCCWSLALFFHLFNGIRHLFWDISHGFSNKSMNLTGMIVVLLTIISAISTWFLMIYS